MHHQGRALRVAGAVFWGGIACLVAAGTAVPAWAGLTICNETGERRSVAIGYKEDGRWVSEGWWNVSPGACSTVVGDDLTQRYYYYLASSPSGEFEGQDYLFCTQREPFTIIGDEDCEARGLTTGNFREIDTGPKARDFTLTMTNGASPGAAPPASAPPGQYGEPFTVTGTNTGCDRIDGLLACTVLFEGWRYVAMDDGRTPVPLLDRLDALPMNQQVEIEGDMVAQGDVSVDVVLRAVRPLAGTGATGDPTTNALIGLWASRYDPNSTLRFTAEGEQIMYYQGDMVERDPFYVGPVCPDGRPPGDSPILVVTSTIDNMAMCYAVDRITRDSLTLMYLDRGNFHEYRRIGD